MQRHRAPAHRSSHWSCATPGAHLVVARSCCTTARIVSWQTPESAAIATRSRSVHRSRTTGVLLRTVDIGPKRVLPLAVRDLRDPLPAHLVGRVVDQAVKPTGFGNRPVDEGVAVGFFRDVAGG